MPRQQMRVREAVIHTPHIIGIIVIIGLKENFTHALFRHKGEIYVKFTY